MKPRITFSLTADGPSEHDEVQVRSRSYKPEDKVIEYGKVLFRPDEWDERYYPHVLNDG